MLTRCEFISKIAARCAWLNMLALLFLFHSGGDAMELPAGVLKAVMRLLLLPALHRRQGGREPAADTLQEGDGHLQIPLQGHSRRLRLPLRWPLCSQKQFRFLENALAHHA
jgi:hypothetical protein